MSPNEDHVDSAIQKVEHLYRQVTGRAAPAPADTPYAAIPAERDPIEYVEEQMVRLSQALTGVVRVEPAETPAFTPAVSLWEDADGYVLCVDLPGVLRSSLTISVAGGAIEVSGERCAPRDVSGAQLRFTERLGGRFRRMIALPPNANATELRADLRDGVLSIHVPRSTAARPIPLT